MFNPLLYIKNRLEILHKRYKNQIGELIMMLPSEKKIQAY